MPEIQTLDLGQDNYKSRIIYSGNVAFVDGTESYIYVTEFYKKYVTKHSWSKDEESEAWIQIPYRVELARGTAKIVGAKQK